MWSRQAKKSRSLTGSLFTRNQSPIIVKQSGPELGSANISLRIGVIGAQRNLSVASGRKSQLGADRKRQFGCQRCDGSDARHGVRVNIDVDLTQRRMKQDVIDRTPCFPI